MYGPAPARRKKTSIVRTRTGCKGCRERRTKCDEQKPSCGTCMRSGKLCEPTKPNIEFRNVSWDPSGVREKTDSTQRCHAVRGTAAARHDNDGGVLTDAPSNASFSVQPCTRQVTERRYTKRQVRQREGDDHAISFSARALIVHDLHLHRERAYHNNAVLSLSTPLSPPQSPFDVAQYYLTAWKSQCVPALPTAFHHFGDFRSRSPLIMDIMIALSACRISRTTPQRKVICDANNISRSFRPDAGHESLSYQHYGSVMHEIASWKSEDFMKHPILGLALLVLFCYLAASMGSFSEYRLHSEAAHKLIENHNDSVMSYGIEVLAALVEVQMQIWWRRVYFSRPDFHLDHSSLALDPRWELALNTAGKLRATVLLILSESHRTNMEAIVSCRDWEQERCEAVDTPSSSSPRGLPIEPYVSSLNAESAKLDEWFAFLPPSELPRSSKSRQAEQRTTLDGLEVQPLLFQTHNAAMNFAYYVVARAMQCTGPLMALQIDASPSNLDAAYEAVEKWIMMLLRIVAGLDWTQCIQNNVFTIGVVGLLLAGALRSCSQAVGVWIQDWLEGHLTGSDFEEGNFPTFQALDVLRLINRERRAGRDISAVFQTVDDGGGKGKCSSYDSQLLASVWVYGRCRATGRLCAYRCET